MNKNKKGLKLSLLSLIAILIAYIVIDYVNLPQILGLDITNVNMDLFGILFNSFVVVLLYIITYFVIDKKQVEKEDNAKRTAYILMSLSYESCKDTILLFDNNEIICKHIVPKVKFSETYDNNLIIQNIENKPFSEYEHVLQLAENGHIDDKRLEQYLRFMNDYKTYISLKITFFDIDSAKTPELVELKNHIKTKRTSLINTINDELQFLANKE